MSPPRAALPERAQPAQGSQLATSGTYADGAIAARDALAILKFGEAPRVGVLGDSGTGKSFALKWLIAAYLEMEPRGVAIIVDDKPKQRFVGQVRRDIADLRRRPPDPKGPRAIVLRGEPYAIGGDVDPETVAEFQLEQSHRKRPTVGVYDELGKAADGGQWLAGKTSRISWAFGKGRDADVASFWGDQETEGVPRQAFNQSSSLFVFRMRGNPLRLLKKRGYLEGGNVEEVIPRLHGEPLPPAQRGTFVHLRRSQPWDGVIYKFRA